MYLIISKAMKNVKKNTQNFIHAHTQSVPLTALIFK